MYILNWILSKQDNSSYKINTIKDGTTYYLYSKTALPKQDNPNVKCPNPIRYPDIDISFKKRSGKY